MKKTASALLILFLLTSTLLSACGNLLTSKVVVPMIYGSEKQSWIDPLVEEFNKSNQKTSSGAVIEIQATPMGSIESMRAIVNQTEQPVVWSPASSIYMPQANAEWKKTHSDDLIVGSPKDLVLSPIVIAMWKPMAEVLGWPNKPIGWQDIAELSISKEGWAAYGYPEWGSFKFGHTHPDYSNSGYSAIIAQIYAGLGKQRGLTLSDLSNPDMLSFVSDVQSSIIHYGISTGFFANRMFEHGPSYLSAAVMYENLVVEQETKRLNGESNQLEVVSIYPKEGTFWSNHPYIILNAPWVSDEQKEAAEIFETYLLDTPQQIRAIEAGFRPSDPSIALSTPLDAAHGVDPSQPKTVLEVPSAEVLDQVDDLWKQVKKPVDLIVAIDTSGSMSGEKISSARSSLAAFISKLDDRDRLQVITFNSEINTLGDLVELSQNRDEMVRRVSGLIEDGSTRLFDAVEFAYQNLEQNGDPSHIRAIVVLSDGVDTESTLTLNDVLGQLNSGSEEGGNSIKLFTISYGDDADTETLSSLSDITGASMYKADPKTIDEVYKEIATFF